MAKTGEAATKTFQEETGVTWLDASKNQDVEKVVKELEARCHGANGMMAVYVQVEGKLGLLLEAYRKMEKALQEKTQEIESLEEQMVSNQKMTSE
jgi:predicted RNase H-like nuclease (RuvC/YqgF family)